MAIKLSRNPLKDKIILDESFTVTENSYDNKQIKVDYTGKLNSIQIEAIRNTFQKLEVNADIVSDFEIERAMKTISENYTLYERASDNDNWVVVEESDIFEFSDLKFIIDTTFYELLMRKENNKKK